MWCKLVLLKIFKQPRNWRSCPGGRAKPSSTLTLEEQKLQGTDSVGKGATPRENLLSDCITYFFKAIFLDLYSKARISQCKGERVVIWPIKETRCMII